MALRATLVLLTACGRLDFDERVAGSGDGGTVDSNRPDGAAVGCPSVYQSIGSLPNRYRFLGTGTYDANKATCRSEGTEPLIVDSQAEDDALLVDAGMRGVGGVLWIGVESDPQVMWITARGDPATFLPWATGSPAAPAASLAVAMRMLNPEVGRFVTTDRSQAVGFVTYCECIP